MDAALRTKLAELRKLSSHEAADWLIREMPQSGADFGDAIKLIAHRSWESADQIKLARHYLIAPVFGSSRPYGAFASFMKTKSLLHVLEEAIPGDAAHRDLLKYHLTPILSAMAKNQEDRDAVDRFLS